MPLTNTQTIIWRCDACAAVCQDGGGPIPIPDLASPRYPFPPAGWTRLGDLVFCPDHRLQVLVHTAHTGRSDTTRTFKVTPPA